MTPFPRPTLEIAFDAHLTNTALSISEVTYLLGYSEPTAFHRACRRWFGGITAQAFREAGRPKTLAR